MKTILLLILSVVLFTSCSNDDMNPEPTVKSDIHITQDEIPAKMLGKFDLREGTYNYTQGTITITKETITIDIPGHIYKVIILKEVSVTMVKDCYLLIVYPSTNETIKIGDILNGNTPMITFNQWSFVNYTDHPELHQPTTPVEPETPIEEPNTPIIIG